MANETAANNNALNEHTATVDRNRQALGKFTDSLQKAFGDAVAGIIQGAPKTFSEASGPLLSAFGQSGQSLQRVMGGAEAYVGVWRNLTTRGIDFGNQLDQMAIIAGQANINLAELSKLAEKNSKTFAGLGTTANAGILDFLKQQGEFLNATRGEALDLRRSLDRLGFSTDAINERFLQYDKIAVITNMRETRDGLQRQRAATAFAEEMQRLSKLTGEQADQLAEDMAKVARKGNVFAFTQQIDERARDEVLGTFVRMGKFGQDIGNLTTDIVTRGFPNPDDPAVMALHAFAPDLVKTLHGIRQAALAGDEAQVKRLQDIAAAQAAALQNDSNVLQMAQLGNVNAFSGGLARALGDIVSSVEGMSDSEVRRRMNNENATAEQIAAWKRAQIDKEIEAQKDINNQGGPAQATLNTYLDGLRALQQTAAVLQKKTLETIFNNLARVSTLIRRQFGDVDPAAAAERVTATIGGALQEILPTVGMTDDQRETYDLRRDVNRRIGELVAAAEVATQQGNPQLARLLSDQAQSLGVQMESYGTSQGATRDEILASLKSSMDTMVANNMTVNANNVTIDAERMQSMEEELRRRLGLSTGTMGVTGKLFQDFGKATTVDLHGLEAVVTPDQMTEIVRNAARGALAAAQQSYMDSGSANNNMASLNGMLNTIRANIVEPNNNVNTSIDVTPIQQAIMNIAGQLKTPLEEALASTLKQPLLELVSVNKEGVELNNQINKGIGAMSGDLLRGA